MGVRATRSNAIASRGRLVLSIALVLTLILTLTCNSRIEGLCYTV